MAPFFLYPHRFSHSTIINKDDYKFYSKGHQKCLNYLDC